jgi:hypothetical protein
MSYIRDLNQDPLNHRYIDQQNCVEYIFAGFSGELSQSQKKRLIKKHATPRKYEASLVDTKTAIIDFGPPSWKTQVIVFCPDAKDEA